MTVQTHPLALFADDPDAMLELGRGEPLPSAACRTVLDLVQTHTGATPDAVAVEGGGSRLTYRELDTWAGRIAARLAESGVGRGSRVGILVEPSPAMVAAALGVLRAGAAYVPVDQGHPTQRIAQVFDDAGVACVLVSSVTAERVRSHVPAVHVEDTRQGPVAEPLPVRAGDAAYVIYTSGSTGEPKGVLVEHGNLLASTLARHHVYPGQPVFLVLSPLAFDSSVAGIWGTLGAGGRVVVASTEDVRDPQRLVELISRSRVTNLLCVPSLYRVLLDAADRHGRQLLNSLTTVIVAGNVLPESLVERHFLGHPQVALVNEYGPTEATVWASYRRFLAPGEVSIGVPVPGVRLYVLDEDGRPVARGVPGELYIGGPGVARGYLGRPTATAAAFVDDPFNGGRMYRTGDIVCWNRDGMLGFRGRCDHQVKICGHRVELGAVEAALLALPGVRDAAVVPDKSHTHLVGFVVAADTFDGPAARETLSAALPEVMVPSRIEVLDRFPVTVTGKVDRTRLADAAVPVVTSPVSIADDVTEQVAAAWRDVLELPEVPHEVNFLELGGNSLATFRLQNALEANTGSRPSIVALFRHTTVAAQAKLIRDGGALPGESAAGMRDASARRSAAMRARRMRAQRGAAK